MVVPVAHLPSFAFSPPETQAEMLRFIAALRQCFASKGLDCVTFERFVPLRHTHAMHCQIHVIPIPSSASMKASDLLLKRAAASGLAFERVVGGKDLDSNPLAKRQQQTTRQAYLYFQLPGMKTAKGTQVEHFIYSATSASHARVPMNFPREFVAQLLGTPERADWKLCPQLPPKEETKAADKFRKLFEPFEPQFDD
eukprot:GHVT01049644.1.p1 GENE.GHVT01049644.1~~GHVT01049644.1.p1  ORF type:complete len:197 (-),score=35.75 GHVT01049644.1:430-1020(-)